MAHPKLLGWLRHFNTVEQSNKELYNISGKTALSTFTYNFTSFVLQTSYAILR